MTKLLTGKLELFSETEPETPSNLIYWTGTEVSSPSKTAESQKWLSRLNRKGRGTLFLFLTMKVPFFDQGMKRNELSQMNVSSISPNMMKLS